MPCPPGCSEPACRGLASSRYNWAPGLCSGKMAKLAEVISAIMEGVAARGSRQAVAAAAAACLRAAMAIDSAEVDNDVLWKEQVQHAALSAHRSLHKSGDTPHKLGLDADRAETKLCNAEYAALRTLRQAKCARHGGSGSNKWIVKGGGMLGGEVKQTKEGSAVAPVDQAVNLLELVEREVVDEVCPVVKRNAYQELMQGEELVLVVVEKGCQNHPEVGCLCAGG